MILTKQSEIQQALDRADTALQEIRLLNHGMYAHKIGSQMNCVLNGSENIKYYFKKGAVESKMFEEFYQRVVELEQQIILLQTNH